MGFREKMEAATSNPVNEPPENLEEINEPPIIPILPDIDEPAEPVVKKQTLKEQMRQDMKKILANDNELAVVIKYIKEEDNEELELNALLDLREFDSTDGNSRIMLDNAVCFLDIEFEPSIYDKVIYDNTLYRVANFVKTPTYYKLSLVADRTTTGVHMSGRLR
ncbi:hypothetical protein YY92_08180 [Campylobacter fetus]|uniref:hypothetical protein n=1 Tax=Campylobacter fetus TaxID=196 RepID=UPI0011CC86A3|nr:hypothetical protein [Campylobacter fetus]EAJ1232634.1 hypothetical protein [Campylobacter fetus]EAK0414687.1 hypothetical protein [Campylobacter fetus]TXF09197.1 hypothetical protein FPD25_03425 [Campylobacter fetus subsp. fetus]